MLPVNFLQISDQFISSCTNFICRVSQCQQSIVTVRSMCTSPVYSSPSVQDWPKKHYLMALIFN